ncbi:MAG: FAD-dependent oxidoreductase [Phycisphaerales bacterium]|nr:FAD-dependent oxidoreductase [Phycisphaerales bacterium]
MMAGSRADVVVIGGGITGLWIRASLSRAGYGVVLIERSCLGDGQTMRSQGILHRGVKYAFSESARGASEQLADAATVWESALRGEGLLNLSTVRVLSECTYLWTVGGVLANLTAWSASKALRSGVRELERGAFPAGFAGAPAAVRVWRVDEPVVDPLSLVAAVRDAGSGPIVLGDVNFIGERGKSSGGGVEVDALMHNGEIAEISAGCVVCAAGEGNEELLHLAGIHEVWKVAQRRALHMGIIEGAPFELFGHVPRAGTDKPRITVTTSRVGSGRDQKLVWYVGGNIAERGVKQEEDEFRESALAEVRECVPWADLSRARFSSLRIDRAEGKTESGERPDGPVVRRFGRIMGVWPTKLALAPIAAEMALAEVRGMEISPGSQRLENDALAAEVCELPWEDDGRVWVRVAERQ